jgi:hypothetical protein
MRLRKQLTTKELHTYVEDYHRAFPSWHVLEDEILARDSGPILQIMGFERLSTGDYRPTFGIYYLCVPDRDGTFGHQWLSGRVRIIRPRAHASLRDKVVEAIHKEVIPSVDQPLKPSDILAMHEAYKPIRSPDAHRLAALNAYLGNEERAIHWCHRFPELVDSHGLGWQDFDKKRLVFLESLEHWIKVGEAKQQLVRIVDSERKNWGLS